MDVKVIGIHKVRDLFGVQRAMFMIAFGDIIVSDSFAVTSASLARELNKSRRTGTMPIIEAYASSDSPRINFKIKFKS